MEPSKRKYVKSKKDYKITSKYYLDNRKSGLSERLIKAKNINQEVTNSHVISTQDININLSDVSISIIGAEDFLEIKKSLYIRVTAKGQMTAMVSRLGLKVTETEFGKIYDNPIYKEFMDNEVRSIEQTIRRWGGDNDNFNIKDWLFSYSQGLINVDQYIKTLVINDLYNALEAEYSIHPFYLSKVFTDESFDLVGVLSKMGISKAIDISNKYGALLKAQDIQSRLSDLSTLNYNYCLLDCFTGLYQDHIRTKINEPEADLYLDRFENTILPDLLSIYF